jgi:hypothetical protein
MAGQPDHCGARTFRYGPPGTEGTSKMTGCQAQAVFSVNGQPVCSAHLVRVVRAELERASAKGANSVPVCHWGDQDSPVLTYEAHYRLLPGEPAKAKP